MGNIINDELKSQGYNLKERAYVIGGTIAGVVAPVVAARYLMFNGPAENFMGEALAWTFSVVLNATTMIIKPYIPVPVYTGLAGFGIGSLAAHNSQQKRIKQESQLENIAQEN
ncbi:MAG: hypothetical protein ABIB43_04630 [archaeon]